jgi:predicted esterase
MRDLSPIVTLLQERDRIIIEGTLDEVIDLAKEYHINSTLTNTTTPYKVMVDKIKQRLTLEKYDWTTI